MKVDLEGKFALVTGAARGIGESIADTLAANGARVAYADIDFAAVKKSAANSAGGLAVEMDIRQRSPELDGRRWAEVLRQFGQKPRHSGE